MKKLILIVLTLFIVSCDDTVEEYSPEQQLQHTSLEVINNIDTNYTVSTVGENIYLLKNNKVYHTGRLITNTDQDVVTAGGLIIFVLIMLIWGFIIGKL